MLLSRRPVRRRAVAGAIGAGAIASVMLLGATPSALADPPPNCTAADLAGVASDVAAATSAYLFTHPDVDDFFTGLKGRPKNESRGDVPHYLHDSPQTKGDLQGLPQPLVDLKNRCQ